MLKRVSYFALMSIVTTGMLASLINAEAASSHNRRPGYYVDEFGMTIGRFPRGRWNAITDVAGVRIGHTTLIEGTGPLQPGKGPVRTGVTVIVPSDDDIWTNKLYAGSYIQNGNGEFTAQMWLKESGRLESLIAFTNTHSVYDVAKALVRYNMLRHPQIGLSDDSTTAVVMECDDGALNDIRGFHVTEEHVFKAIHNADSGPVEQGGVGAGTGMISYRFKAGIGSSSRLVEIGGKTYTVGVILNANHGDRETFLFNGRAVGREITTHLPQLARDGSITVVLATDAPLDSRQLERLAARSAMGVSRTGAIAKHGSGDVFLAFSTANKIPHYPEQTLYRSEFLSEYHLNPLFEAAAEVTEEAVLNSILAARTMVGRDGNTVYAIPKDCLKKLLPAK